MQNIEFSLYKNVHILDCVTIPFMAGERCPTENTLGQPWVVKLLHCGHVGKCMCDIFFYETGLAREEKSGAGYVFDTPERMCEPGLSQPPFLLPHRG